MPELVLHDTRRGYITSALDAGIDTILVARQVGHAKWRRLADTTVVRLRSCKRCPLASPIPLAGVRGDAARSEHRLRGCWLACSSGLCSLTCTCHLGSQPATTPGDPGYGPGLLLVSPLSRLHLTPRLTYAQALRRWCAGRCAGYCSVCSGVIALLLIPLLFWELPPDSGEDASCDERRGLMTPPSAPAARSSEQAG